MTAMVLPVPLIGSALLAFLRSTAPASADAREMALASGVLTSDFDAPGSAGGGSSKTPTANNERISRKTMSLSRLIDTLCCCTAVLRALLK